MAREFEFSLTTKAKAYERQNGRCGICGQRFYKTGNKSQAHHIVSALYGGDDSLENCVILCTERGDGADENDKGGCHKYAHGGSYNKDFQLNRSQYKHLNG